MGAMLMNGNELMHYGVLGMKWGVRRKRDTGKSDKAKQTKSARKKLSPKTKRRIAIALAVAANMTLAVAVTPKATTAIKKALYQDELRRRKKIVGDPLDKWTDPEGLEEILAGRRRA